MNYEQLLTAADQEGLLVKEQPLTGHDGLIRGSRIAIRKYIETQAEKSCVLAEEIGHYHTSSGNILDQSKAESRKQEYRARLYGYNLKIGLTGLISAYEAGCGNLYEMAEYLNATEEYLKEAIQCYHSKYGVYAVVDNYVIYFEPFAVIHMISSTDQRMELLLPDSLLEEYRDFTIEQISRMTGYHQKLIQLRVAN